MKHAIAAKTATALSPLSARGDRSEVSFPGPGENIVRAQKTWPLLVIGVHIRRKKRTCAK